MQSVPMQETKCADKAKTHSFSGWQREVPTKLGAGQGLKLKFLKGIISKPL